MAIFQRLRAWFARVVGVAKEPKESHDGRVSDLLAQVGELGERIWRWLEPPSSVLEDMEGDFRLACKGAEAAARAELHETNPPYAKMALVAKFADWMLGLRNRHARQIARSGAILGKLTPQPYLGGNRVVTLRAEAQITETRALQNLKTKFSEASEAEAEYALFRYVHRLGRAPHIPANPLMWAFVLGVIIFVEGALNGFAFAYAGGFEGLINAVIGGFLISLATVALGFITGFIALRYIGYSVREQPIVERFWRVGGAIIGVGSLLIVIVMIAEIAVSRWMTGANAVKMVLGSGHVDVVPPFVFALAFVGLSAFSYFFSVLKSYEEFSDPFPGYGRAFKARKLARERFEAEKRVFLKTITEEHSAVLKKLINDLEGEVEQVSEMKALFQESAAFDSSVRSALPAGWQRILAPFSAYDEGFAAVSPERREAVAAPDKPPEPEFQPLPPFEEVIAAAERIIEANKASHEVMVKTFSDELQGRLKTLLDLVENWEGDFQRRFRPYGPLGELRAADPRGQEDD